MVKKARRKTTSALTSPHLIQSVMGVPQSQPQQQPPKSSQTAGENNKVKILPPKPFRDPSPRQKEDAENTKRHSLTEFKVQKKSGLQRMNSVGQPPTSTADISELKVEPASSVPMRRKAKENVLDHSTFSLSR